MKLNGDWICLPCLLFGYYPPEVTDLVKASLGDEINEADFDRHCDIVGKQKGIKPGKFLNKWIPRDKIELLETVQEHVDNPDQSSLWFEDEDFMVVDLPHDKLMKKIHNFMRSEPLYRNDPAEPYQVTYVPLPPPSQEEIDEMGEDQDE